MVQVEALSLPPAQLDLMRQMVSGYLIGAAQLDGFQHANRSLCDSILGGSLSGKVLFRIPAAGQIVNRPSCPLSRRQGFSDHAVAERFAVGTEVLQLDSMVTEILEQSLGVGKQAGGSAKQQTIKTGQNTRDNRGMALYKRLHGVAPEIEWKSVKTSSLLSGTTPFPLPLLVAAMPR